MDDSLCWFPILSCPVAVPTSSQDCAENDLLQGLKVAVCASNLYFRTMRKHGVFIPPTDRAVVVRAGEEMVDPWWLYIWYYHIPFCGIYSLWLHAKPNLICSDSRGRFIFFPWIFQFSNVQIIWRPMFCTSWGVKNMNMILECQEAYSYLATKCYRAGVKLFRLHPKIHFQCHLTMNMALGSSGFSVLSFLNANSVCMETYFQFVFQFWFSCTTTAPLN